jgi:hypothetical protein
VQAHRYGTVFELIQGSDIQLNSLISATVPLAAVPALLPGLNALTTAGMTIVDMLKK